MRAYATLLMGLTDNQTTTRVSLALAHNVAIFNRTRCFQNRLRELKPGLIAVLRELNDAGPGAAGAGKRE